MVCAGVVFWLSGSYDSLVFLDTILMRSFGKPGCWNGRRMCGEFFIHR